MRITAKGLRDLFFLAVGTAILFHEFWQQPDPSPLGVFVSLFLFGLIPAFRADDANGQGPLALLMSMLASRDTRESRATLAEQEARVERAEQAVKAREAARAAAAELAAREARRSQSSRRESNEPDSQ